MKTLPEFSDLSSLGEPEDRMGDFHEPNASVAVSRPLPRRKSSKMTQAKGCCWSRPQETSLPVAQAASPPPPASNVTTQQNGPQADGKSAPDSVTLQRLMGNRMVSAKSAAGEVGRRISRQRVRIWYWYGKIFHSASLPC